MPRGKNSLAPQVQQALGRDPYAGDLYVFRGRRGELVKIAWHDGVSNVALHEAAPEATGGGRFIWPSPADGCLSISGSQLAYMPDGMEGDPDRPRAVLLARLQGGHQAPGAV